MNISFFLKPKSQVSYLYDDCPALQAMKDMVKSDFTAIPMIDRKGKYKGTVCEGDFLRLMMKYTPEQIEKMKVGKVKRRFRHNSVSIDSRMEDLVNLVIDQNFVPVTDGRGMFIGIITRHDILSHLQNSIKTASLVNGHERTQPIKKIAAGG